MTDRPIHAVSVEPGHSATVCGLSLGREVICTGWGRPQQNVCPGVTCRNCEGAMGLRVDYAEVTMPPIGHFLRALGVDPASATDDQPRVQFVGDRVFVHYTGMVQVSPAEFSRAAVYFDGWSPA